MIRETLSANSRYAYALVSSSYGVGFQISGVYRRAWLWCGTVRAGRSPYWVRLRRIGNAFTAYVSADGLAWRQHGATTTSAMGTQMSMWGLQSPAIATGRSRRSVFSNVSYGPRRNDADPDEFAAGD